MKLTKGKINKIKGKRNQSKRRIGRKHKHLVKHGRDLSYRKKRHFNLKNQTLKRFGIEGGADGDGDETDGEEESEEESEEENEEGEEGVNDDEKGEGGKEKDGVGNEVEPEDGTNVEVKNETGENVDETQVDNDEIKNNTNATITDVYRILVIIFKKGNVNIFKKLRLELC
jgi:hypothetical protein